MKKLLVTLLLGVSVWAQAQTTYFETKGVAINGYDVVSYFTDNKAIEGQKDLKYSWGGTQWQFATAEHLEMFKANPEKYAPQFGGYCAYGVSEDHKSPTEPAAFTVVDEKLYLNYNMKVRELWRKDTQGRILKGEKNWVQLKDTKE